ncbi:conserved hypothetical protein (putative transposase or invertase) [Pedobacter westerhofensis]|uniref:Uncharacterized protein n=1 Tax=Pedobacter westerhofensis TaxID=425512 RepID=A0A521C4R9_9SPHI|nr:hypothetical protein [Pedobacter westerhofensis]SMO54335.1 conserved hypothetical protein (putative transposase or invertase) [Pedobacter westerhofensis]
MERSTEEIQQKIEWDHYAILQTARREGLRQGLKEGLKEGVYNVARNLKNQGFTTETIKAATNLSIAEIKKL